MDLTLTVVGVICLVLGIFFTVDTSSEHYLCTGALALVGFILLILGLVSSKHELTNIQQPGNQQPMFYCKECGKPIYKNSKYCENCGTEFINR